MAKISVQVEFKIQQKVWLVTDPDQYERIVIEIIILPGDVVKYKLGCGSDEPSDHYGFEISECKGIF